MLTTGGITSRLESLGNEEGCTLFMTVLAVFDTLLSRYAGQEDVVVGTPVANRAQPGIYAGKKVLMFPGLNHAGLAQALGNRTPDVRYADPMIFFGLPRFPGVGSRETLDQVAPSTLRGLRSLDFGRLRPPPGEFRSRSRHTRRTSSAAARRSW